MILFFTFCGFCVSQENPLTSFCYSTNILFLASEAPLLSLVQQHLPLLTFSYCEVPSFFIALFCCMVANTLSLHMCLSQVWTLAVAHSRQSQLTKSLRKLVFHPVKEVLCQGKVVKAWLNSDNKMRNVTVQWIKLCILFCCVTWWKVMVWVCLIFSYDQIAGLGFGGGFHRGDPFSLLYIGVCEIDMTYYCHANLGPWLRRCLPGVSTSPSNLLCFRFQILVAESESLSSTHTQGKGS